MRRLAVTNHSDRAREIEVTSYAEIVLAPPADDLAHPAFGKLFVETEYLPGADGAPLSAAGRARADEAALWAVHVLSLEGRPAGPARVGDRPRALPRPRARPGGSPGARRTLALRHDRRRARSRSSACASASASRRAASCACRSPPAWRSRRDTAVALAQKYHEPSSAARTFALAFAHAQSALRHLGITSEEALLYERLASRVLYADARCAPAPSSLPAASSARRALWPHGISGDLPILLVRVVEEDDLPLVRAGPAGAGVLAAQGAAAPTS